MKQQFHRGDEVYIETLPQGMSHFPQNVPGIIVGSYYDGYGNGNRHEYEIDVKGRGESAWFPEAQLTLIKKCETCRCCRQRIIRRSEEL